ncbi:hypothetical protein PU02_0617 [Bartonella ancashensis]|uniref:Uncharacterized protein n=1 Tax=Bartonella ancashensis TaxID=1318743 RepID=A0A0M3T2U0_9HYPH|nr:hypothetical protein PU02_0617 [Bartonella ancashensis]
MLFDRAFFPLDTIMLCFFVLSSFKGEFYSAQDECSQI